MKTTRRAWSESENYCPIMSRIWFSFESISSLGVLIVLARSRRSRSLTYSRFLCTSLFPKPPPVGFLTLKPYSQNRKKTKGRTATRTHTNNGKDSNDVDRRLLEPARDRRDVRRRCVDLRMPRTTRRFIRSETNDAEKRNEEDDSESSRSSGVRENVREKKLCRCEENDHVGIEIKENSDRRGRGVVGISIQGLHEKSYAGEEVRRVNTRVSKASWRARARSEHTLNTQRTILPRTHVYIYIYIHPRYD